jgi:hypothetical protein
MGWPDGPSDLGAQGPSSGCCQPINPPEGCLLQEIPWVQSGLVRL